MRMHRWFCHVLLGVLASLWSALPAQADAPEKQPAPAAAAVELPMGNLDTEDWLTAPTTRLEPGEIDRMISKALADVKLEPSPLTTDEQFVRRVYLDLTGKLPTPAVISEFSADKDADKRAKLIDKLLDSDDYARHFAKYWREVFGGNRLTDFRARQFQNHFERWLVQQFRENRKWSGIAKDMLTAKGEIKNAEPNENGQLFFLISRKGADARTEIAAETSRIFLGIQIQCAQCHDHPSDIWQREQFHEFAAYFARYRERTIREENRIIGSQLTSLPTGEHRMPDPDNPRSAKTVTPRFLDGKRPANAGLAKAGIAAKAARPAFPGKGPKGPKGGRGFGGFGGFGGLNDADRRTSLADSIASKDNPWFAGAMVNRMWALLMGQAFYSPIDDMGPMKEAVMPDVLVRVAASFRGTDHDIKALLRDIMTSETYQRQVRPGESIDSHLLFAGTKAQRMNANELWNVLSGTLGGLTGGRGAKGGFGGGAFGRFGGGLEGTFRQEFGFDPSTTPEEIEGSVSQALLLMNNPVINNKIEAKGGNVLARILATHSDNDEAIRQVYLRTLARRPTDRELERCRDHIASLTSRSEAFEDILWALINSTEYQTRR